MIPTTTAYDRSKTLPAMSRAEVETLLSKFNITKTMWKRDDPADTFFVFEKPFDGIQQPLSYKVSVPHIEKKTKHGREYDEVRAYRFFYHIFKACMMNFDIGMHFEQIFGNYLIVDSLKDGTPISVQDKIHKSLAAGHAPALVQLQ